jgi:hypothetical protein
MILRTIGRVFYALVIPLCMMGCETQSVNRIAENVFIAPGYHPKITKVALITIKSNDRMIEYSKVQILEALESQFKKEQVQFTIDSPTFEIGAVDRKFEPTYLMYLTISQTTFRAALLHMDEGSEDNINGFSYQIKIMEGSTKKIICIYNGKVANERPGHAALWVGRRFFERLKQEGLF